MNTLLLNTLNTKQNKELKMDQKVKGDPNEWLDVDQVAGHIRKWADGEDRPEHGSMVEFKMNTKNKLVELDFL